MLSFQRAVTSAKAAILISAVTVTAAVGAERVVSSKTTPRGKPAPAGFKISGSIAEALRPGRTVTLDLRLVNRHRWSLDVSRVSVDLVVVGQPKTGGCQRLTHFRQRAIPRAAYPLRLPPKSSRTLRQLGVRSLPTVSMLNLPNNQDVCKGRKLRLRFAGRSVRAGKPFAR